MVVRGVLRAGGVIMSVVLSLLITIFVALGGDGISVGAAPGGLEAALRAQTGASNVAVGSVHLVRDQRGAAPFLLTVRDVTIDQGGGQLVVPALAVRMSAKNLLRGQSIPRFVEITGADLTVQRQAGQVAVGGKAFGGAPMDVIGLVAQARAAGFEGAVLRDVDVALLGADSDVLFAVEGGTAALGMGADGYQFTMTVPATKTDTDSGAADAVTLALDLDDRRGAYRAQLTVDRAPADMLVPLFAGQDQTIQFDAPVSGTVSAAGDLDGDFGDLRIDLAIDAGSLSVRDRTFPVQSARLLGQFRPADGTLSVDELRYVLPANRGVVRGQVDLVRTASSLERVRFDVVGADIVSNGAGLLAEGLTIPNAKAAGYFDLTDRSLVIDTLDADYFDARLTGTMAIALPLMDGQSPGLQAQLSVDGEVTPAQVLAGWPPALGDGARRWVDANLTSATLSNVGYKMAVPRGAISDGAPMTQEALDLSFDARNATIIYVPGMTPITGLAAKGRIKGNSFELDAKGGRAGKVRVLSGSIRMDQLVPKGSPGVFQVKVAGNLSDMLALVDEQPLGYISKAGFDPTAFGGKGTFDLTVIRPLLAHVPIADYDFKGAGFFQDLTLDVERFAAPITGGKGMVTLTKNALTISGNANIEEVPTEFSWARTFGRRATMNLWAQAKLNAAAADAMGLPLRRYIRGDVDTRIEAVGSKASFDQVQIVSDLTQAAITTDDRDFIKRRGEPGEASALVKFGQDGVITIESMMLSMAGANVEGNAKFAADGALLDLDLPRLFVENQADLSARIVREADVMRVLVEGSYLYAGTLIDDLFNAGDGSGLPGELALDAALETVDLKGAVALKDVTVTGSHSGEEMGYLSLAGQFDGGGTLSVTVGDNAKRLGRDIRLVTDRFGLLLEGVFGVTSVSGGDAILTATDLDDGPVAGRLKAQEILIKDAPTVARLLSVGSLDGLEAVLNGEGLSFTEFDSDIQFEDGALRLVDARLTGSALGLSANGTVDLGEGAFALRGAVAPAYGVNSFFAHVPGVGELFVPRQGEGVFAFAYRVDGPIGTPVISVNTLTALTPGILRRLFDPAAGKNPTTDDILNAAEASARRDEERQFLSTPELLQEYERSHPPQNAQ